MTVQEFLPLIGNTTYIKVQNIITGETHYGILGELLDILLGWGPNAPIYVSFGSTVRDLVNPVSQVKI